MATQAVPRPRPVQPPHAVPFLLASEELPLAPKPDPKKARPQSRAYKPIQVVPLGLSASQVHAVWV